jgi:hypothetical protein
MSQNVKSWVLCLVMLMFVTALTITGLLILRQRRADARLPLKSKAAQFQITQSAPQSRQSENQSPQGTTTHASPERQWNLETWLRKPASQTPSVSVVPVLDKKLIGVEASVTF